MKKRSVILFLFLLLTGVSFATGKGESARQISFDFYGDTITIEGVKTSCVDFDGPLSQEAIHQFYDEIKSAGYEPVIDALRKYKNENKPDDWLCYQLVRKTAQYFSPKGDNYLQYTLYKWYFLTQLGYDATLNIAGNQLLFYVQCSENIYDIPFHKRDGKQYVCLNYHDYGSIDFEKTKFKMVVVDVPGAVSAFSYKLTRLPGFAPEDYQEKDIEFSYNDMDYRFKVKLNSKVQNIFTNYPVADYQLYFSTPLSSETYKSLIPQLKENIKDMGTRKGVDYLMRFTRYAFLYQRDMEHFGKEKRFLPEQTLLYEGSDCEDRAALFFCLVKEIYNLPMIVLAYPEHVSIAIKFDKPIGTPIIYNGEKYTICEPTPQKNDMPIGKMSREQRNMPYEVAFAYKP